MDAPSESPVKKFAQYINHVLLLFKKKNSLEKSETVLKRVEEGILGWPCRAGCPPRSGAPMALSSRLPVPGSSRVVVLVGLCVGSRQSTIPLVKVEILNSTQQLRGGWPRRSCCPPRGCLLFLRCSIPSARRKLKLSPCAVPVQAWPAGTWSAAGQERVCRHVEVLARVPSVKSPKRSNDMQQFPSSREYLYVTDRVPLLRGVAP